MTRVNHTADRRSLICGALPLLALVLTACQPATRGTPSARAAASLPNSAEVLRAAGVPPSLSGVEPGMTYRELTETRPSSRVAGGIGREEEAAGWLAWYFFGDPPSPAPGTPLGELRQHLVAEPGADQRMLRAEFRRLNVSAREVDGVWKGAVAASQRAARARARCTRFELRNGMDGRNELRRGIDAHLPLPVEHGAPPRQVIIGSVISAPAETLRPTANDSLAGRVASFVVTLEPVPDQDLFGIFRMGQFECPAPSDR